MATKSKTVSGDSPTPTPTPQPAPKPLPPAPNPDPRPIVPDRNYYQRFVTVSTLENASQALLPGDPLLTDPVFATAKPGEHLTFLLSSGWTIVSVSPGSSSNQNVFWLVQVAPPPNATKGTQSKTTKKKS
jgi:hypothetical protein